MPSLACGVLEIDPALQVTAHEYRLAVSAGVSRMARSGAQLIVMPAHLGLAGASAGRSVPAGKHGLDAVAWAASLVSASQLSDWQDFYAASALSNKVYLCPGSYWAPVEGGYVNRADLYSPKGEIIGEAIQTHSTEQEEKAGLLCGTSLPVFRVANMTLGIELATDVWYPEVGRIHALQGADLIIALTAVPAPYTVWRQTAGLWQIAQANQVFGIEASLSGSWLGTTYHGRSRAFAPVECTEGGRGVLAEITSDSESDDFVVQLDTDMLKKARAAFPVFGHFNIDLYVDRLADAYLTTRTVKVATPVERRR